MESVEDVPMQKAEIVPSSQMKEKQLFQKQESITSNKQAE